MNMETQEVIEDHPLDDYYRQKFEEAKRMKEQGLDPRDVFKTREEPTKDGKPEDDIATDNGGGKEGTVGE